MKKQACDGCLLIMLSIRSAASLVAFFSAFSTASACFPSTDPGACDDGTGPSACAAAGGFSHVFHLSVSGSGLDTVGACLYEFDPAGSPAGDVVTHRGGFGTDPWVSFNAAHTANGFRVTNIAWDSPWEDAGEGNAGSILLAAGRVKAVLDWIYRHVHGASKKLPYCAQGTSGGSSAMLYAITHYGEGDSKLDHVMLQAATPFARVDIGCDPNAPPLARTVCPDVDDLDQNYVGNQIDIITSSSHVQSCMGSPTASELQTLASQSIVSEGEQTTFTKTSISAFYCQRSPNLTIAGGTYFFGADNTNIATNLKTPSYHPDGSLRCGAGENCRPQIVCAPLSSSCNGESVERDPEIFDQMVADMKLNCIPRHSAPSHHRPPHPPPPPSPPVAEKDPCDDACGPNRRCVQVTSPPVPSWGCFDD